MQGRTAHLPCRAFVFSCKHPAKCRVEQLELLVQDPFDSCKHPAKCRVEQLFGCCKFCDFAVDILRNAGSNSFLILHSNNGAAVNIL